MSAAMGLLSRLLGNASEADVADVEEYLEKILAEGEKVQRAFALVRDLCRESVDLMIL